MESCVENAFPTTVLWGYGDPNTANTFSNPAFTIEVGVNQVTRVKWSNELIVEPAECHNKGNSVGHTHGHGHGYGRGKGQSGSICDFLQHIVADSEGVPVVDQTLLWANPAQNCRDGSSRPDCRGGTAAPYLGPVPMVTNVHGAHVHSVSSGNPDAWWLPAAGNIPTSYALSGTFFDDASSNEANKGDEGYAIYEYPNNQPSASLWYRDQSLGIARLNQYAAGAGFWLIRDPGSLSGETGLFSGVLPGPAVGLGADPNVDLGVRSVIREIPLIIQDQSFNRDGSLFYPANRAF